MEYEYSSEEEEEALPIYECAYAELLAAGVDADVRPLLRKGVAALAEAYALLPPTVQERWRAQAVRMLCCSTSQLFIARERIRARRIPGRP